MSINLATHKWAEIKNLKSFYYPEVTSTNDVAKSEFQSTGENFALYLTDHQTQGRGRGDNSWENLSNGEVLLSTWCFRLDTPPQPILTPLLGLAVYESLYVFDSSLPIHLKAPNDLYLNNGKLAGLLVEVVQQGNESLVFVGLGMNVTDAPQVDLPTSCLEDTVTDFRAQWPEFCKFLYNQFLMAMDSGSQKELGEDECEDLLEALNAGLPESQHYTKVSPNCDLHGPSGVTPWTSL